MSETNNKEKKDSNREPSENDRDRRSDDETLPGVTSEESQNAESAIEADLAQLQKQLTDSEQAMNAYKDQLLRLAAEFDNFRKRVEVDRAEFIKFSNEKIIKELLPVLDDFERALSNGRKSADYESFLKGVELIYQKLYKTLEEKGLKPIESIGKEFDVMYHDVLMQIQRPDVKPHTIVEEVERGYTLHGKVIKHAKVIVAAESKDGLENDEQK